MSKNFPSPLDSIRRHNLNLKKSLGQNLLIDTAHLARIADAAELTKEDTVLEIGPGLGALTHLLAERAGRVVAVELDQRLIPILREQFADQPHVSFVHGDILELSPAGLIQAQLPAETGAASAAIEFKVVANLPYYITSAALRHILERADARPTLAVLLVQREVAQRMIAQPGDMSLLAVGVQFYARPRALHSVPAGAFLPRPKSTAALCAWICTSNPRSPMWTQPNSFASYAPVSGSAANNCATASAPVCPAKKRTPTSG